MAGHRPVRPQEQSFEPLTETDRDETMTDNPDDDEAGETSAVKSKIQSVRPSDQEIATHEACSHYPYRDWCRACVGVLGGQTLTNDGVMSRTVWLWPACMDYGFFTDGDESDTRGATPFLVVNIKPIVMLLSMLVQCKVVGDQAAGNSRVVE